MESNEKNLSALKSLEIIEQMIDSTKANYGKQRSFYYLMWGWLILSAIVLQYALIKSPLVQWNFIPWVVLMPLGGVLSMLYANKHREKDKKESYLSHFFGVFFSSGALLFIFGVFFCVTNNISTVPLMMLISGFYGIVAGRLLKFPAFVVGGILFIALAVWANYTNFEIQLLLMAVGIVTGYLVPGYLLKFKSKEYVETT